jgi:gelsolin
MFKVQEGGVESGFNHVTPEAYTPRLFQVRSNKAVKGTAGLLIREVPMSHKSLNSGDVFIADTGKEILQWNGASSSGVEKAKAAEYSRRLSDQRNGKAKVTVFGKHTAALCNCSII